MLSPVRRRGFSVIELMVVVAIIGLLTALAAPGFQLMIANSKVRGVSDSLQNGLRLAQAEASRRQRVTVFYRSSDAACSLAAAPDAGGNHWLVRALPSVAGGPAEILQCGSSAETTGQPVVVAGTVAICFSVEGRQQAVANGDPGMINASCTVQAAHELNISSAKADRPLRVRVTSAGSVRLCDPSKPYATATPDGCP